MNKNEVQLLSREIEMLMAERTNLLKVVGAAAKLVDYLEAGQLPPQAVEPAEQVSAYLNALPEESLRDALDAVQRGI